MDKCPALLVVAMLAGAALATPSAVPEPIYQRGSLSFALDDPVEFPDLTASLAGLKDFKAGLAARAWAVALPAASFFLAAFAVYVVAALACQMAFAAFQGKLVLFRGLWSYLARAKNGIFAQLYRMGARARDDEMEDDVAGDVRERRNAGFPTESQLLNLISGLGDVLTKYD